MVIQLSSTNGACCGGASSRIASDVQRLELLDETDMGEYVVRRELWQFGLTSADSSEMTSAYTSEGAYIGDPDWAAYLASEGIVPELRAPESNVCSVGFCALTETWYGWSHRAKCGFAIGHKVEPGHLPAQHVGFVARTLEDCRMLAVAFAEEVG